MIIPRYLKNENNFLNKAYTAFLLKNIDEDIFTAV